MLSGLLLVLLGYAGYWQHTRNIRTHNAELAALNARLNEEVKERKHAEDLLEVKNEELEVQHEAIKEPCFECRQRRTRHRYQFETRYLSIARYCLFLFDQHREYRWRSFRRDVAGYQIIRFAFGKPLLIFLWRHQCVKRFYAGLPVYRLHFHVRRRRKVSRVTGQGLVPGL